MNYQSFIHLQLKTLLKNVFHSIKIELGDVKGEKKSFCFRWNYTSCSLFSQDFGQSFLIYTSHKMVAQSSANFPIYCGHARQCGQGFRLVNVLSTCEKLLLTKKTKFEMNYFELDLIFTCC